MSPTVEPFWLNPVLARESYKLHEPSAPLARILSS